MGVDSVVIILMKLFNVFDIMCIMLEQKIASRGQILSFFVTLLSMYFAPSVCVLWSVCKMTYQLLFIWSSLGWWMEFQGGGEFYFWSQIPIATHTHPYS